MTKAKSRIRELVRVDLREKYRHEFFGVFDGADCSAQHRFVPTLDDAVRMSFSSAPYKTQADFVIESLNGGEHWEPILADRAPPSDRGLFISKGRLMAVCGGLSFWRSFDGGLKWNHGEIINADETQMDGLGDPNNFSVIKITRGLYKDRIVCVGSYFTGQEGPDTELVGSTYTDDWGDTWHHSKLFGPPDPLPGIAEGFGEPAVVE